MDWFLILSFSIILFGYGLYALPLPRRKKLSDTIPREWPAVSFIIPAYNEQDFLQDKINNTLSCDYPTDKLEIIIAADGSNDDSETIVGGFKVRYENNGSRKGKGAAMNRAAQYASHDILIFSDANAMLNKGAIKEIVLPLLSDEYAMSSGEKKVIKKSEAENASAGEGLYWKYESYLKKRDDEFHTLVAAVGELFAIKKENFTTIPENVLLDDFFEAASVLLQGKKISYVPKALATEFGSLNFKEEIKRKIRIAAGGYQSMAMFKDLFNPIRDWKVCYLFIAHRVLRWTIIPLLYFLLPCYIIYQAVVSPNLVYITLAVASVAYFIASLFGLFINIANRKAPFFLNIPFYISLMNYCALHGAFRYINGIQSGAWEKVKRS
ncbi:glycosyltransferase [Luteibaculum oceani]|uniref:glycosyltransferase n=1 Tax=Luteibaculum oceani TaxID=1294296 RepID=UPI00147688B3|nr:glycosyltransferase [Luteibaculum oceani]